MPKVGSFGPLVFEVSDERVRTPARLERRLSARFAEHEIAQGKTRLERVGEGLSEITMRMRFSVETGLNPQKELALLEDLLKEGSVFPLLIGENPCYNLGRFVVSEIREIFTRTDGKGHLLSAEVEVKLKEYA